MASAPIAASIDPRALEILQRRPRLALALIAIYEMTENRRNCRVSLDVSGGCLRIFRENQERVIPLGDAPGGPAS